MKLSSKTSRLFLTLVAAYFFIVGSWWFEVLRFSYGLLNYISLLVALLIPIALIILSFQFKAAWMKAVSILCLLPVALLSSLLALLVLFGFSWIKIDGTDYSFERIRIVEAEHYRVSVYRTNSGATTAFGIVLRQEKQVLPGIYLIRKVHSVYPASDAEVTVVDKDTFRILVPLYREYVESGKKEVILKLKRYVYL